jgi:hypothetical protein
MLAVPPEFARRYEARLAQQNIMAGQRPHYPAILILAILPISGYEGAGLRWGMSVLAAGGRRTGTT